MMHLALLLFFLVTSSALAAQQAGQSTSSGGEAVLELPDLSGRRQSLADYRGRIVVLNFWATWCVPCREEMPILVSLQRRYGERGVQVIGASVDWESSRQEVARFAQKMKLNFPVWAGATVADMQRLGLGTALPATAIIGRDGTIAARILGIIDRDDMEERVEWLLGDRSSLAPPALIDNIEKHQHDHEREGAGGDGHEHRGEEEHEHAPGLEGASTVPS